VAAGSRALRVDAEARCPLLLPPTAVAAAAVAAAAAAAAAAAVAAAGAGGVSRLTREKVKSFISADSSA
jgi:hypothetical protein